MTANAPVDHAGPPSRTRPGAKARHATAAGIVRMAIAALVVAFVSFAVTSTTAQETTPTASPSPAVTPAPDAPRLVLELREFNDSGVSGTATLYDAGDRTIVEIDAENTGENHPSHIHAGRCDDLTPEVAYPLQNVRADGKATSVVDVSLSELLASEFSVDMHLAPTELGTLIACAEIEGEPTVPEATPSATPGSPVATPSATPGDGTGGVTTPTATATVTVTATAATVAPSPTATATTAPAETPVQTPAPTTPAAETPTPAPTVAETPTPVSDGTGGAIAAEEGVASVPLLTQNDSGVTGTAILTAQGAQTRIAIVLSGPVTGGQVADLHDGSCAAPGELTITLNPVESTGVSQTLVDIPLANLLGDGYFINVHESEATWDSWLVCGDLASATRGLVAPATGGQQPTPTAAAPSQIAVVPTPVPTQIVTTQGDGTAGISGKGVPIGQTTALPQRAGVGAALHWPSDPITAVIWASGTAAVVLAAGASLIRRGERTHRDHPPRWTRLGI